MDKLYFISLKMLKDKYDLDEYPREKFNIIYYQIFGSNKNLEINDLNKLVLKKINESILNNKNDNERRNENDFRNDKNDNDKRNDKNDNDKKNEIRDIKNENDRKNDEMEIKMNEMRDIRNNMTLNKDLNLNLASTLKNIDIDDKINEIEELRNNMIINANLNSNSNINQNQNVKYKTFIINSIKNNFTTNINKTNIYPLLLLLPSFIKNKSPYIILSLSDSYNNNVNYTFIYDKNSSNWDIWKPVIKSYNKIILENTNWNIKLFDYNNHPISLNEYYSTTLEILENNNYFNIKIDKIHLFNLNDKIKIIFSNNYTTDNIISEIDIENKTIKISKNNINIQEFINSKIFNYNYQFSLIFKYH